MRSTRLSSSYKIDRSSSSSQKIKMGLLKDLSINMFKVKSIIEIDDDEEDIENKFYVNGNWCVKHHHIIEHVKDQGWFS